MPIDLSTALKWKALLILKRHLDIFLRQQFLQVDDPHSLQKQLEAWFYHEKTIFFPQARNDWLHLRVLEFPNFLAFNTELHWITTELQLCGEEIIDKELIDTTLSTFSHAFALLAQQYRNMKFKTHSQLISYLLFAKKQHLLMLQNAESKPMKEAHTVEMAV